jgi:hypothetical protein
MDRQINCVGLMDARSLHEGMYNSPTVSWVAVVANFNASLYRIKLLLAALLRPWLHGVGGEDAGTGVTASGPFG